MSMDLRGQVWKLVWIMTFYGLKSGQNLENRAAHPYQEFPGVPPREPGALSLKFRQLPGPKNCCCLVKIKVSILLQKKWSVSRSKWTGFLAGTLAFILQIFIWTSVRARNVARDPRNGPLVRLGYFMVTQIVMIDSFHLFIYFLTTSCFDFINDSLVGIPLSSRPGNQLLRFFLGFKDQPNIL